MVRGYALLQFDTFSAEVGSTTAVNFTSIILGFGTYLFLLMHFKKSVMHRGMSNPHGSKVRFYAACMIDPNKYLAVFSGEKASEKIV